MVGAGVVYDTVYVTFEVAFGHLGRLHAGWRDRVLGNLVHSKVSKVRRQARANQMIPAQVNEAGWLVPWFGWDREHQMAWPCHLCLTSCPDPSRVGVEEPPWNLAWSQAVMPV